MRPTHIVHVFSTYDAGGPQVRTADLIRRLPDGYEHSILAMDRRYGCRERTPEDRVRKWLHLDEVGPGLLKPRRFARYVLAQKPDVVATYNWGAIETVLGLRWAGFDGVIHHGEGFGPDEFVKQKTRRVLARRYALGRAQLVVCSFGLEGIAREIWRVAPERLHMIPNGIDLEKFEKDPGGARRADAKRGFGLDPESLVIGSVGHLRPEKNFMRLAETFASVAREFPSARLLLVGDGVERAAIEAFLQARGLRDRAMLTGKLNDPRDAYAAMDIFALTSNTEQMPISLLEAMAVGRAVFATDVGDIRAMLAEECRAFVGAPDELAQSATRLLGDAELRERLAHANQVHCAAEYPMELCVQRYRELYDAARERSRS